MAWNSLIGWPNCSRSFAYSIESSMAACAVPTACAATFAPPAREEVHQLVEASARFSDEVLLGHANVVDDDFGQIRRADAELVVDFLGLQAVGVRRHEERADALVAGVGVSLGHHDHHVGDSSVRNPHLIAVKDPAVAVAFGVGLDTSHVRAMGGFADGAGTRRLAAGDLRQPLLFHPLVAVLLNHARPEATGANGAPDARVGPPEFLGDDDASEAVHPRAAVLLGDFRRDEVVLCRLLHQFRRVAFLPIAFLSERLDFVLAEFAHRFSDCRLLGRQAKRHIRCVTATQI